MHLPKALCASLDLEANLVTASGVQLVLHCLDHGCKALDAFDQRVFFFPLPAGKL